MKSADSTLAPPLLELRDVRRVFAPTRTLGTRIAQALRLATAQQAVRALDGVSLVVRPGEVVGVVGESGCGKSTAARLAAGLLAPSDGDVQVAGQPVRLDAADRRRRARIVQMVFQDPMSSLNPRRRVADAVLDGPRAHGLVSPTETQAFVAGALQAVGLDESAQRRYPHELSGGQRQRVGIARALAMSPQLIVCDEAVAALDVSVQAQVLNLFVQLRQERQLAYLFISHDLGVVRYLSDRVVVMYLGRVVEEGPAEQVFARPLHPYTQALVAETDRIDAGARRFPPLQGEVPSPSNPPAGCHFHPRCPRAEARCRSEPPALRRLGPHQAVACHLAAA
jgi:oligopeptide/dipeptide ABC transporter ATP-binding protein